MMTCGKVYEYTMTGDHRDDCTILQATCGFDKGWLCPECSATAQAALESMRHENEVMRSTIEAVEWDRGGMCPWCHRWKTDVHKPDCQRQRALGVQP